MGRRGPKPEPAAIKAKKGDTGHRPIGADPVLKDSVIEQLPSIAPPSWLKDEGLDVWGRLAPRLQLLKLLTFADIDTFARYCRNFARWLKMQRIIDSEGETYETETYGTAAETSAGAEPRPGSTMKRVHPALLIADRLERQLLATEDRFGLNPAERQRLFAARSVNPDPATRGLFDADGRREGDAAARPTEPAIPERGTIGILQ